MKILPTLILATAAMSLAVATNIHAAVTASQAAQVSSRLALTILNPRPAGGYKFGWSVAAMDSSRVLIGAPWDGMGAISAGVVYLFSTSGVWLTTFTNPTPVANDNFGRSVAAVGWDCVVIGTPFKDTRGPLDVGMAYLFSTNGALITTFTNPTPAASENFGWSVAAVGTDRVLIGAWQDDAGANNAGAAYLFSTNGTLLTTFTNPTPAADDLFGVSVAAVGTDRVLIGAYWDDTGANSAGAAYLLSANGALLTTFTNPAPAAGDFFGFSVAAVGTDRVLIGAYLDDTGVKDAGAAYLFSTNGMLLTTFTNPAPTAFDNFGISVAAVGTDWVLIGADTESKGATYDGAAYLFSTNGALLTTITNPTPAIGDRFGHFVAAVGTNQVLIGEYGDDAEGAIDAGAAYLFSLEPITPPAPSLSTSRNLSLSTLTISWPAPAEGWLLEGTNALPSVPASSWPPVPPPYQTNAETISVTFTNAPATGNQFFRLRQP